MDKQDITLYKRLLAYAKPHWVMVVIMLVATGVYASTNAVYVAKLKTIIDEGFIQKDMTAIYATISILILVTFLRGISFFVSNYIMRRVSSDIVLSLRNDMFSHLQRLPSHYFDRVNTGETLSRFNYDVSQVTAAATNAVIVLVREGVLVVVLLSYLFYQNWKLTLLIFALTPFIGIIIVLISKRLRMLAQGIQANMGNMNHILDENIKGHKVIKVYAGQLQQVQKFYKAIRQIRNATIKSEVATSSSTPIIEMLIVCVLSTIIWLLAREAKFGHLTPGAFLSYTVMMSLLPSAIKKLMRINEEIQRGLAASKSLFGFLDETPEPEEKSAAKAPTPQFSGAIAFEQVTFRYDETPILSDFNLRICAGETVALVGASGSGKSSLAALIPRFYEACSGVIKLDGIAIGDMPLSLLRQQIAFVSQETVLFDDSVIHNIAYGQKDIDISRAKHAAQLAQAEEFISEMEAGYNSQIGESGQRLSGGQRQRLAIARAIYKDAPIIILDEATSALDKKSERKVQQALAGLLKDRTAIVIAHRLSTIENADRIVVLDQGQIVEQGTHEALLAAKGKYYNLNQAMGE